MTGEVCPPPKDADIALRYLRDRISVPRDMSIYAAKRLRSALESTAALAGDRQGEPIPTRHRRDQDPVKFRH
jgi:glutathione S-transferase